MEHARALERLEHQLRQAEQRQESERRATEDAVRRLEAERERNARAREERDDAMRFRDDALSELAEAEEMLAMEEALERADAAEVDALREAAARMARDERDARDAREAEMREEIAREEAMRATMIERTRDTTVSLAIAELSRDMPNGPWNSLDDVPEEFLRVVARLCETRRANEALRDAVLRSDDRS